MLMVEMKGILLGMMMVEWLVQRKAGEMVECLGSQLADRKG